MISYDTMVSYMSVKLLIAWTHFQEWERKRTTECSTFAIYG